MILENQTQLKTRIKPDLGYNPKQEISDIVSIEFHSLLDFNFLHKARASLSRDFSQRFKYSVNLSSDPVLRNLSFVFNVVVTSTLLNT